MPMRIFLFDPSMRDNSGAPSVNLGDLIIFQAVKDILTDLLPGISVLRASSHVPPDVDLHAETQRADLVLVGGTNLLSSHVLEYDQWKLASVAGHYEHPPALRAVLLGVGWWQYQDAPDTTTRRYYRQLLHESLPHAVRDSYTVKKLEICGVDNVLNTSCPTLWALHGKETRRTGNNRRCLFCLTDYMPAPEDDDRLIPLLAECYPDGLLFFPQGDHDEAYAATLPAFRENSSRIRCLPHAVEALYAATLPEDRGGLDYVGTRLHAGAWCLRQGMPSCILAVDNRSREIAKDTNLPVIDRGNVKALSVWINGGPPDTPVTLPLKAIAAWKDALARYGRKAS